MFSHSEHRDVERGSNAMPDTEQNLDEMFGWRAIIDSLEQSLVAFGCVNFPILTHASDRVG